MNNRRERARIEGVRQEIVLLLLGLSLLGVFLPSLPVRGSQSLPLNLEQMGRSAGQVFVGVVQDVRSGRDVYGFPATFTAFEVEFVLKGSLRPGEWVQIKQFGYGGPPPSPGELFRVYGLPRYRPGERYLVLLYPPSRWGFQSPVGLMQGVFRVDAEGRAVNALNNGGLFRKLSGSSLRGLSLSLGTGERTRVRKRLREHRSGPLPLRDLLVVLGAFLGTPVDEGRLRALEARIAAHPPAPVKGQAGPLLATGGLPVPWDIPSAINSRPSRTAIPYSTDQGRLGALTKAQADQLVAEAFGVWAAVADASIAVQKAGDLPVDVTAANAQTVLGVQDGISPIVYDADGSLTAALNGAGAECEILGFAGPEFGGPDEVFGAVITEASAVLNGLFVDGQDNLGRCPFPAEMPLDRFRGVFVHEFGHYLNLDHTQVNGQHTAAFLGGVGEPAFPGVLGEPPLESTNTMFPIAIGHDANTLGFDDVVSVASQYPTAAFLAKGTIQGRVLRPDGTPFNCADVIVRSVSDPFYTAASGVSGALFFDTVFGGAQTPGEDGVYRVPGLPAGEYLVHVEGVNPGFTQGSGVGPCDPPVALPGPPEFYSGPTESADPTLDDPSGFSPVVVPGSGGVVSGVDIRLNGGGGTPSPAPIPLDVLRDVTRCVLTPVRSVALRTLVLRNSSGQAVTITDVRPAAGSDWVDFRLLRGLGPVLPGRFGLVLARGTCVGNNLALEISLDTGGVLSTGLLLPPVAEPPGHSRLPTPSLQVQDGLLRVWMEGSDVLQTRMGIYRLDGRRVVYAQARGPRLTAPLHDEGGRPLAGGVYLAVIAVERGDGTLQRKTFKIVVRR